MLVIQTVSQYLSVSLCLTVCRLSLLIWRLPRSFKVTTLDFQPLFLYLAHQAVHSGNPVYPLIAPWKYMEQVKHIKSKTRRTYAGDFSVWFDELLCISKMTFTYFINWAIFAKLAGEMLVRCNAMKSKYATVYYWHRPITPYILYISVLTCTAIYKGNHYLNATHLNVHACECFCFCETFQHVWILSSVWSVERDIVLRSQGRRICRIEQ